MKNQINNYIQNLTKTLNHLNVSDIEACASILLEAYENGRNIFICGNGGSAATASHFACDINKGVSYGLDKRFKIIPLTDNLGTITAYSNDVGYDVVFVEQLKNFYKRGDVIIGISGSGNSKNVLKAIEFVNNHGGKSIGWTGFDGGVLKEIAHLSVNANINDMQISEDVHMSMVHILMTVLSKELSIRKEQRVITLQNSRSSIFRKKVNV